MKWILAFVLPAVLAACTAAGQQRAPAAPLECPEVYNGCFSD